ncbi:MAG: EAL domain-containing protein [Mycobacteriales bacterium]
MSTADRPGLPGRLKGLVAGMAAVALAMTGVAGWQVLHGPAVTWTQLLLLVVMLPLSELALLHVRHGSDQLSFTWGEACVLAGFALVTPAWLVLLAPFAVTAVHLVARRPLVKAIFNGASFTAAAGTGAVVLTLLTDAPYRLSTPGDALALGLAVTAFSLVSVLGSSFAVAFAQGANPWEVLRDGARMTTFVWSGNLTCAGALLYLAERSPSTLLAMPPVMVAVYVVYRAYLGASQERDAWQQLESATRELNKLDEREVVEAALSRARQLFRTDDVALDLVGLGDRPARTYVLDGAGRCMVRPSQGHLDVAPGLRTVVELAPHTGRLPLATTLVAPLEGPTGRLGVLQLGFGGPVRLTGRERQVLSTYAHAVSTSLLNVALYDEVRAEAARQAYEASHDPLTGLANRLLLQERTEQAIAEGSGCTAMLLLDLDHFKEINDTLGHAAGDVMLQHVAARLRKAVGDTGLVARLGGDEFAVLLTGLAGPEQAAPLADAVLARLGEPVDYQGLHLPIEGSIGLACHPQDADSADELFRRADVAMYQAKADRGSWLRYDNLRDDSSVQRLSLVSELRHALDDDQLVVHYQPQVDLETGLLVGAEALVRWQHPERGLLQPADFVGVAEQSGLVRRFTMRVLELAVAECATWQLDRPLSVAVNLGARSLLDRELPDAVAAVLARHHLPADRLVLEITETTATSELEVVEEVLGRLRRLGVEISVDDFGTGYSSLAFLQRTAVHELKVDRSFVCGMLVNDNDLALVRATVQLAHSLGARAVAEGVESQALAVALTSLGCDVAQGYHLGRPMPAEQLRPLLRAVTAVNVPRQDGERYLSAVNL